jgi:hypothetical protein
MFCSGQYRYLRKVCWWFHNVCSRLCRLRCMWGFWSV